MFFGSIIEIEVNHLKNEKTFEDHSSKGFFSPLKQF